MVEPAAEPKCPDCGTPLSDEPWAAGLCLSCLVDLAQDDTSLDAELRVGPGEAPTLHFGPDETFSAGQIQGERYRIRSLLGRGGMGEVWRAYDLKLRQDVALKALRKDLTRDRQALEILRQEVRTAREVISPNVCRVFDLQELDGQELVSMEYIDGTTLQEVLLERSPLDLDEGREIASQFLAGLEAIHDAGLVHRDIKPENLMITRTGRVVVMDFGIAKGLGDSKDGIIAGTPAYMSPEQTEGKTLDARSDVFSAGVVLAEMVAPGGVQSFEDRKRIWDAAHRETPELEETPWSRVIGRSIDGTREVRYAGAAELARALEEVTLRAAGDEDADPYPGLASFTEEQSRYFFGRELEVEELWKKLRRPHLLAVIAPSGSGKSSFLKAGLLPTLPKDWGSILVTPGNRPFVSLARALAEDLTDNGEPVDQLLRFEEPEMTLGLVSRWRQQHEHALIIVDQFEELFTLSSPEVQERFAQLLGQIPLETDVFVLLSMREDFFYHCQPFKSLAPVFSELMPLGSLTGNSLRRALVQPALKCGYRYENEALVDEMVEEVSRERGALPLLAFAASRLWALRDRDTGLITTESYEAIGGVGGALAQHAEATLKNIGQEHISTVRELFRNLVTAQGTRAARDREELLSVFGSPKIDTAGRVLDSLIDARLLTAYEVPTVDDESTAHQWVEIVHESLLSNWPRLVRWRTQDAEGAQLRDDLRQAAKRWEEKDQPEDLLWTGTAVLEYRLWRERYPGGLTQSEETFAAAMTELAERRRRRRRWVLAAVIAALALGLTVVVGLWRQAEQSRQQAEEETLRAESSKLLALGRLELEGFPTGALAYATKSLELADSPEARRFALGILWRGPIARIMPDLEAYTMAMSPDGDWLAFISRRHLELVSAEGRRFPEMGQQGEHFSQVGFSASGDVVFRALQGGETTTLERWTIPELAELPLLHWDHKVFFEPANQLGLPVVRQVDPRSGTWDFSLLPAASMRRPKVEPRPLGRWQGGPGGFWVDPTGRQVLYGRGHDLLLQPLGSGDAAAVRRLGESEKEIRTYDFSPDATLVASSERDSENMYIWSVAEGAKRPLLELAGNKNPDPLSYPGFSRDNTRLVMASSSERSVYLWDLVTPLDGRPLVLPKKDGSDGYKGIFHPEGRWLTTLHALNVAFWPVEWPFARSVSPHGDRGFAWLSGLDFSPDSKWLAACSGWSGLHLWPLEVGLGSDRSVPNKCLSMDFDPSGRQLLAGGNGFVTLGVVDAETPNILIESGGWFHEVAFDPSGRYVAATPSQFVPDPEGARLWVWDLETGEARDLDLLTGCQPEGEWDQLSCLALSLGFAVDNKLWIAGPGGMRRWDLSSAEPEWVLGPDPEVAARVAFSEDGRKGVSIISKTGGSQESVENTHRPVSVEYRWMDLETGEERFLEGFPTSGFTAGSIDPSGQILAVGTSQGDIWVGRLSGGEPHLLVGRGELVARLVISPDGRWLASHDRSEILLWPMPDLDKAPFHSLPYDELLAKLHTLTNLRAIEDTTSESGWKLDVGAFPGWLVVPEW